MGPAHKVLLAGTHLGLPHWESGWVGRGSSRNIHRETELCGFRMRAGGIPTIVPPHTAKLDSVLAW